MYPSLVDKQSFANAIRHPGVFEYLNDQRLSDHTDDVIHIYPYIVASLNLMYEIKIINNVMFGVWNT